MIKFHDVEQQTDEWFKLRLDFPFTASNAQKIGNGVTKKGELSSSMKNFVEEKIAEKYSSAPKKELENEHLIRGNELEPLSRSYYEFENDVNVEEVGFITNSKYKMTGISPDGLIGKDGLFETKSPMDRKHFFFIVNGLELESQYMWQVQMQMLITERKWVDFVSYNPNFPERLLVKRVASNKEKQELIKEGLEKALEYYQELNNNYKKICQKKN